MYPFFKVPIIKKVISYIVPVTVASSSSKQNPFLEFILYRNQWQLATEDALYSDGDRYLPFRVAFKRVSKDKLENLGDCVVLGAGLGSIVQILSGKYRCKARYVLVEHDAMILDWAIKNLSSKGIANVVSHCESAEDYVKKERRQFDLVCIDIFSGREVPPLFTEKDFLLETRRVLKPGGMWMMNYIINDPREFAVYMDTVRAIFPEILVLEKEQNRILIYKG